MPVARKRTKKADTPVVEEPPKEVAEEESPVQREEEKRVDADGGQQHVILQLPISAQRMDELLSNEDIHTILEYKPEIKEPVPYTPMNTFVSRNDELETIDKGDNGQGDAGSGTVGEKGEPSTPGANNHTSACYWCCHPVGADACGMPIQYDVVHRSFTMYGTFCSLECAAAMNFSQHMGSDRAWEIHSWIQTLGKRYGATAPIRPAPSRYLLKMFQGPLTIEEFRNVHRSGDRTFVLNVPPFVSVPSQMEVLNTSFLVGSAAGWKDAKAAPAKKSRAQKSGALLDTKLNLTIEEDGLKAI